MTLACLVGQKKVGLNLRSLKAAPGEHPFLHALDGTERLIVWDAPCHRQIVQGSDRKDIHDHWKEPSPQIATAGRSG
jgi:hypothetical protein